MDIAVKPHAPRGECCNCHRGIGSQYKRQPFFVDDGGEGNLPWCPACFFAVRAPKEPDRWKAICAVTCAHCGWESVAFGVKLNELVKCPHCGRGPTKIALPPELVKRVATVD